MNISSFFVFTIILLLTDYASSSCSYQPSGNNQPIITNTSNEFIYPPAKNYPITVLNGTLLHVSCVQSLLQSLNVSTTTVTCQNFIFVTAGGVTVNLSALKCVQPVASSVHRTGRVCHSTATELEIGFQLTATNFLPLVSACFDEAASSTLYVRSTITRFIMSRFIVARPSFVELNCYNLPGVRVDAVYSQNDTRIVINGLLGLPADSNQYIKKDGKNYLARGHFAAKTDFVYPMQQRATFCFLNAAPQWQIFNTPTWRDLEAKVHNFADNRMADLQTYTGGYGVLTLPHAKTTQEVELWLLNGNRFPVPKVFWKVVHDPVTKRGVVILGTNNPYKTGRYFICTVDVSKRIKWIDLTNPGTYACEVDDFRRRVSYLPPMDVSGGLLV